MKNIAILNLTLLFFCISIQLDAQIFYEPHAVLCAQNFWTDRSLTLDKVESTETETILYFTHTSPSYYTDGGWVNINGNTYLQDVCESNKYKLIKVKGVPISPDKHNFTASGQTLHFQLHFERIPDSLNQFDMIECPESFNCFNFINISLELTKTKAKQLEEYLAKNFPFELISFFYTKNGSLKNTSFYNNYDAYLKKEEAVINLKTGIYDEEGKKYIQGRVGSNSFIAIFNMNRSNQDLECLKIEFPTKSEASVFIKSFSQFFHLIKESDSHYIHPIDLDFGRFVTQEDKTVSIYSIM